MADTRPEYLEAVQSQRLAADPKATRLASANAGSGKTKVLVDRVSSLLWEGAEPDKILCLTYTKAAAAEMQSRLFATLGNWSIMEKEDLGEALNSLSDKPQIHSSKQLKRARRLFAKALEAPEGLRIQTIHAFCDRILSRFPIEAGLLPGFTPMDDMDILALRAQVETDIYEKAWAAPESDLAQAITYLSAEKTDFSLAPIFRWIAGNTENVARWIDNGGVAPLAAKLGIDSDASPASIKAKFWNDAPRAEIKNAAQALLGSSNANDVKKANKVLEALVTEDAELAFDLYADIFLTQSGTVRKSVVTGKSPDISQAFFGIQKMDDTPEALRVLTAAGQLKAAKCLADTRAILTVAKTYKDLYVNAKLARRWLDFNDQIFHVRNLLTNDAISEWIKYRLDGGIDHILIDEAQDTSPQQWDIIDALKENFQDLTRNKTFFAVGDEKQSIYSFQGAQPEKFVDKIQDYVDDPNAASVRMRMSFRSAPQVLRVVDAVFADKGAIQRMFNPERVNISGDDIAHTAFRTDTGRVELWPLAVRPDDPPKEKPWDTTPLDTPGQSSSREQLALKMSAQIKQWLDNKEPIFDRGLENMDGSKGCTRPMRPEDILILVRQRNAFFDAVIRNLKLQDVPVAGADRLVLKDAMIVKDFLALTRFVLLPADNLSLAEVLKSPLIGYDEDALFSLAFKRGKMSLWDRLKDQRPDTAQTLADIIDYSRRYAPYEFYARVLDMTDGSGESRLKHVYLRLGMEAQDAMQAFLARALAHQRKSAPSLQHFLKEFSDSTQDIKREMDSGANEVRVMTVHGAKGLEAPVVFLPDTTQVPKARSGSDLIKIDYGYAYLPNESSTPSQLAAARNAVADRGMEEYLRLLYVAMTRAESRLIVCGFESGRNKDTGMSEGCWYDEVSSAMADLETDPLITPCGDEGLAYGARPKAAADHKVTGSKKNLKLEAWMHRPAPNESPSTRRVTPSHLLAEDTAEMPVRSPLQTTHDRFLRGNIIHKLLEILPDIDPNRWEPTAEAYLDRHKGIDSIMGQQIWDDVFSVLNHPDYAPIFAPGSRAEISLAGQAESLPSGIYLNGQIDRLAVNDDTVYIIDYKSNRPPPKRQEDVADIYWGQMAAYKDMVKQIYPDKKIICALLWTDGPNLMVLDEARLDATLTRLASILT
jgi:ATP-dependent helicase/nuclease subunit A